VLAHVVQVDRRKNATDQSLQFRLYLFIFLMKNTILLIIPG